MIADELLDGPRGRRLCWQLLELPWNATLDDAGRRVPAWADGLRDGPFDVYAERLDLALRISVGAARYWQEPDEQDALLAVPETADVLRPVAEAVIARGVPAWWSAPLDFDGQVLTVFDGTHSPPLTGAAATLHEWALAEDRAGALLAEHLAQAADPRHAWQHTSGRWWSAPLGPSVPGTTRADAALGPAGLRLVEDEGGFTAAEVNPVAPIRPVRVHEVHVPADWADLVARFPREIGETRGPDWWRATGRIGRWLVPDWPRVAEEFDAVRVSVRGYLATAGRIVPVDGVASLLAGWSPETTYWLTDVLAVTGPPQRWAQDDDGGWTIS